MASLGPIVLTLAISASSRALLIHLVEEKSERFKETQKVNLFFEKIYIIILTLLNIIIIRLWDWDKVLISVPGYFRPILEQLL